MILISPYPNFANAEKQTDVSTKQPACTACAAIQDNLAQTQLNIKDIKLIEDKVNASLQSQQSRLNDIWGIVGLLGFLCAFLGALITVIVVFFSLKSTKAAVSEAKLEANNIVENWLRDKGEAVLIKESAKVIDMQIDDAIKKIKDAATPILLDLDAELQKTTKINQELFAKNGKIESDQEEVVSGDLANVPLEVVNGITPQVNVQQLETVVVADNITLQSLYKKGMLLKEEDRAAEAIAIFESLVDQLEHASLEKEITLYAEAKIQLALISDDKLDQFDKAISVYESLIAKLITTNSEKVSSLIIRACNDLGLMYRRINAYSKAKDSYQNAINLFERVKPKASLAFSRYTRAINGLMSCHFDNNEYLEVIDLYNKYIDLIKQNASNLVSIHGLNINAARSYSMLNKTTEAKELLLHEIKNPVNTRSTYQREKILLAQLFEEEKNYDEALILCNQIIEDFNQKPTKIISASVLQALLRKASILSNKLVVFEEIKTYDDVVELWEKSNVMKEAYSVYAATALVNKALTLTKAGNAKDALNEVNKVMNLFKLSLDHDVVEQTTKAAKLKSLIER